MVNIYDTEVVNRAYLWEILALVIEIDDIFNYGYDAASRKVYIKL